MGMAGDVKTTILNVMKELSKSNKFVHKADIWTYIQKTTDYPNFDKCIARLIDDAAIYPTYENDIFSINPDY